MATTESTTGGLLGTEAITWGMPSAPQLCTDPSTRTHVRKAVQKRFPYPVPNGWFIVAMADELPAGEIASMHYFGRDLIAYRDSSGTPHVLDAYCAHLGAHLAIGGRIDGDCVRCPFHGWAYDGETGKCTDIPYYGTEKIPSQAKIRAYPTLERNRAIWAWYHAEDKPPFYEVPEVPEFDDPEWAEPVLRRFEIATTCQEMAENNHDPVHFQFVHGSPDIPGQEVLIEGTYKRAAAMGGVFVRESFGLGLGVLRITGFTTFLSSTTPIDDEHVDVRWIFTCPNTAGPDAAAQAGDGFMAGVSQDLPIWENKVYVDRPVLIKDERTILDHREWCKKFYSNYA